MPLQAQESAQVEEVVAQVVTHHPALIFAEVGAVILFSLTICAYVLRICFDSTIPSVVKNRVFFGLLAFGLFVFLVREFANSLSVDSKGMLIVAVSSLIAAIIYFLFDKDKEGKDNKQSEDNETTEDNDEEA